MEALFAVKAGPGQDHRPVPSQSRQSMLSSTAVFTLRQSLSLPCVHITAAVLVVCHCANRQIRASSDYSNFMTGHCPADEPVMVLRPLAASGQGQAVSRASAPPPRLSSCLRSYS